MNDGVPEDYKKRSALGKSKKRNKILGSPGLQCTSAVRWKNENAGMQYFSFLRLSWARCARGREVDLPSLASTASSRSPPLVWLVWRASVVATTS
uniref:Uncharacterized protein n=1 Tax=Rhipicephalus appendiculatus TaxID=34631 RepID=A0A131YGS6_RHIAP